MPNIDKQHILEEIQRTAKVNGGVPLGRNRFFKETGIKDHDWQGKFWARWSEAVREAGFTPNLMTAAYDESLLIEKLISLMRELNRFPVGAEIRLKAHNDASFPSHNTFSRLGSKKQCIAKIQNYCKGRVECDDIVALCAAVTTSTILHPTDKNALPEKSFGFVYLIKSGCYYKIGRTNATGRRERELAIQLPEKANTVHSIRQILYI